MCFGIPTSGTLAIVLAALILHGLQPGPLLFGRHAHLAWAVIGSMYVGNVKKRGWPTIALVFGFLLCDPLEQSLRRSTRSGEPA